MKRGRHAKKNFSLYRLINGLLFLVDNQIGLSKHIDVIKLYFSKKSGDRFCILKHIYNIPELNTEHQDILCAIAFGW